MLSRERKRDEGNSASIGFFGRAHGVESIKGSEMWQEIAVLDYPRLGMLLGFSGIVAMAAIAISAIVSSQWRKVRQAEIEASLKAQMLEQGLSAEEIERVICAYPRARRKDYMNQVFAQMDKNCNRRVPI